MHTLNYVKNQKIIYNVPFLATELKEFVLWFFTGTRCNLSCSHCYVESNPDNNSMPYLTYETFEQYLKEAVQKKFSKIDIYFTGGEPFINPDILKMIDKALDYGHTTILTNGTRFSDLIIEKLEKIIEKKKFTLTFRISIDGPTEMEHDKFRGSGSFNKTMLGLKKISNKNFKTIVTAMQSWKQKENNRIDGEFISLLVENDVPKRNQSMKYLPPILIGREEQRNRGYTEQELFTETCFTDYNYEQLQCSKCRMVTEKGVWVCPILVNEQGGKMGNTLVESFKPFGMKYTACWTCRMSGLSCEN